MLAKVIELGKKIFEWLKKYWIFILIIPAILIALNQGGKIISRLFRKPDAPPDPTADQNALRDDIGKIDNNAKDKTDKIDAAAKAKKNGIDSGDPTPAKVFDDVIRGSNGTKNGKA